MITCRATGVSIYPGRLNSSSLTVGTDFNAICIWVPGYPCHSEKDTHKEIKMNINHEIAYSITFLFEIAPNKKIV